MSENGKILLFLRPPAPITPAPMAPDPGYPRYVRETDRVGLPLRPNVHSHARTTSQTVTFHFAFQLPGMTEPHEPGAFEVLNDQELQDVTWEARHSSLRIILVYPGREEALPVSATDLEAAILKDRSGLSEPL